VLETFEYSGPDQEIVTETREFSAVCPYSGLPDFATLTIKYNPFRPLRRAQEPQVLRHQLPQRGDLSGARHRADRGRPVQAAGAADARGDHAVQRAGRVRDYVYGETT
jgi:hypothetical protein